MIYPCIESTIDCLVDDFNIRLWINKDSIPNSLRREQEFTNRIRTLTGYKMPTLIRKIIEIVPKDLQLNAVQVRDGIVGTVVYTTSFSDDIHG